MARLFATTSPEISEREKRNMERSRKIASQGMVLLLNRGALPIEKPGKIALFGSGARWTVKGGTGSGDVNSRFVANVEKGLEEAGFTVTTKSWLDRYDRVVEEAKAAYGEALREAVEKKGVMPILYIFESPYKEPAISMITKEDCEKADADIALFVISRNSGEGKDRRSVSGEYDLFEEEKEALRTLSANFKQVIAVLNVGGVIDTKFLRQEEGIDAILLMSQAGNMGGYALADILTGKETPSGKLTSTWAEDYGDYPGAGQFSHMNGNVDDEYYEEGIYVGYRYFDSFNVTPAYPFGYGMSYTSFAVSTREVKADGRQVTVKVQVQNTGSRYAGREVVQVYYSAPEGTLEKPYQELAAYGKTKELAPGESQELELSFPTERMASYDEGSSSWAMEEGTYYVRVGVSSRNTHVAAALVLDERIVTEVLSSRFAKDCEMRQLSAKGVVPYGYEQEKAQKEAAVRIALSAGDIPCRRVVYRSENPVMKGRKDQVLITMDDVRENRASLEELTSQLTVEEMAQLCVGTARGGMGSDSVVGAASASCPGAAGDTTSLMIGDRNIRNMILADGPAGLRLSRHFAADRDGNLIPGTEDASLGELSLLAGDAGKKELPEGAVTYYQYCSAIPIATLLAQTWDVDVIAQAGDIVGEEMEELGVTLWLAPGMNIHRNPLCGRNFEYYSEDPLAAGMCAAADTMGVQKHAGVGTTIKHFAFNNQEDNRMHTNAHIGERAIREIYLKCFEIAVKTAQPMSIMTSYNLINGIHTANSYDLLTAVARDEWEFEGIVMTDWGTTGSIELNPGQKYKYGSSNAAGCIKAGNDLIMPGSQADVDEIVRSVGAAQGEVPCPITLGDLQACAKRMLKVIALSSAYEGAVPYKPI